jgi:ElaA protein
MPFIIRIANTPDDLELCYEIRREVFVREQSVPIELEMDDLDAVATHFLLLSDAGEAIATARMVDKAGAAKIGRVAVLREYRGQGLGESIMRHVLEEAGRRGYVKAVLSSQTYAIPFYERLGFVAEGSEYDDAGIPHRTMWMDLREEINRR